MPETATISTIPAQALQALRRIVGETSVLSAHEQVLVYECDGFVIEKNTPDCVVFPETTEHVVAIVKLCNEYKIPFVPRGAGTSLAGGCLPVGGGVMIALTRMRGIHDVNLRDHYAVVGPGTVNVHLTQHLKGTGFHYAPDPSSQGACTIGGNVATNSGGPHTLKYGVTVNHVLGAEVVLPDGEVVQFGGYTEDNPGFDLTGLFVGSEGTFGVCTKVIVRLTRDPVAYRTMLGVFETVEDATQAISGIIGAGIVPAALELMDQGIIEAVEPAFHFGFPLDAGAVLLIEVDGLEVAVDGEAAQIVELCEQNNAREVRKADSPQQRDLLWKCRKKAFGAIGRLSPSYCTQDGVVPRTKLPEILKFITEASARHDIRIVNVFHAGDGNIHPILLFDERDAEQVKRVLLASDEILNRCIELGGSVTGEHGIGVEKINFMNKLFTEADLETMEAVRIAFNPTGLCSPQKMLPTAGACGMEHIEKSHPARRAAL
ncbi:putative FAD-linked oxidoreductase [Symmachiella macrocystis]|uniref:Putative FAD-linked oxidoreductase n=1 Tax=Symmachiella macrocystis TaxID=2527985 RepID=A0A5C6BGA8_9PLAN|nr:FAD-linked oxidase C-terminal domain-containing protein [Symmachiella macrocystis]TWU09484.1 putative FAD-linked oxidoreductase [Symmachiella macrocystis]